MQSQVMVRESYQVILGHQLDPLDRVGMATGLVKDNLQNTYNKI
jgi:hypothetical protein